MMSWGAKIKSALHGTVDGADIAALLAASRPLATIRRDLDGRWLDMELAQAQTPDSGSTSPTDREWRSRYDLGEIAAPLWLAEELVALAQHLYETDAAVHPDTPGPMSAVAHDRALALLQPVEHIIIELSAILVDPSRRSSLSLPVSVNPQGNALTGSYALAGSVPASYVRGLLGGAEQVEGAVQVAVSEFAKVAGHAGAPAWLGPAVQRLHGEMAATQTRLEMVRARSAPLLNHQTLDDLTMHQLAADLWLVIDTYLRIGQMIASPRLLPGAPATPPPMQRPVARPPQAPLSPPAMPVQPHDSTIPNNPYPTSQPPLPSRSTIIETSPPHPQPAAPRSAPRIPVPPVERDRQLPQIDPSWHPSTTRDNPVTASGLPPAVIPPAPAVRDRVLPQIGNSNDPGPSAARAHDVRSLPKIGPPDDVRPSPHIGAGDTHAMPDIGSTIPSKPTQINTVRELPQIGVPVQSVSPDSSGAHRSVPPKPASTPTAADRRIGRADRWIFTAPATRHQLRATGQEDQAERELTAFWEARDWTISGREQAYRDAVTALLASGALVATGQHLRTCPFPPIYRVADRSVQLDSQTLSPRSLCTFDYRAGHLALLTTLTTQDSVADT